MVIPVGKLPPVKKAEVFLEKGGIVITEVPKPKPEEEELKKYTLIWVNPDAVEEGYNWTTDFMTKRGFKVIKPEETFRFGFRTPEWQQTQQKLESEMNMATGLLSQISNLMRFLTGMYSQYQKVIEMLKLYKEGKEPDELALKGLWKDYVDFKKAGASIVAYEKNYEYLVLGDLFFSCKTPEDVDAAPVNDRVKVVCKRKLAEYLIWREEWKKNLEHAYGIMEESIKRYENQIELYKDWLKPILRDVTFFKMKNVHIPGTKWQADPLLLEMAHAATGFINVIGWFGLKEEDINNSIKNLNEKEKQLKGESTVKIPFLGEFGSKKDKLTKVDYEEEARELMLKNSYGMWVPVMELKFYTQFTAGGAAERASGYKMVAIVKIISLALFLEKWREEWTVDPAEKWLNQLLDPLNKIKEEAKPKKEESEFEQIFSSINSFIKNVQTLFSKMQKFFSYSSYELHLKKEKAKEDLWDKSWTVYEKFKKAHGMLTWGKYSFKSVSSGVVAVVR